MKKVIEGVNVPIKVWTDEVEMEAVQQLQKLSSLPFVFKHLAVMPDVHAGKGSTVGTVIATQGAICPSCVGVDIGCGMASVKLPFKIDVFQNLPALRHSMERSIPVGHHSNNKLSDSVFGYAQDLYNMSCKSNSTATSEQIAKASYQIGSLGGGNHFIEICQDEDNNAWVMLHSGSRNIGKVLAEKHIDKAKELMKQYFISLPDPDLAYLVQGTTEFKSYLADLMLCQKFALFNREEMLDRALEQIYRHLYSSEWQQKLEHDRPNLFKVNCHHNFTQIENHFGKNIYVTRKGAVSACSGEWGIIPGSMGTESFIVRGLGNRESFNSCSHGAGRKMSRTKARQVFTVEDLKEQTLGVECRKDSAVVDEIPGAYKNINEVMSNQSDLVEPVYRLKQILCIKG